jgi:hypothetical protein
MERRECPRHHAQAVPALHSNKWGIFGFWCVASRRHRITRRRSSIVFSDVRRLDRRGCISWDAARKTRAPIWCTHRHCFDHRSIRLGAHRQPGFRAASSILFGDIRHMRNSRISVPIARPRDRVACICQCSTRTCDLAGDSPPFSPTIRNLHFDCRVRDRTLRVRSILFAKARGRFHLTHSQATNRRSDTNAAKGPDLSGLQSGQSSEAAPGPKRDFGLVEFRNNILGSVRVAAVEIAASCHQKYRRK